MKTFPIFRYGREFTEIRDCFRLLTSIVTEVCQDLGQLLSSSDESIILKIKEKDDLLDRAEGKIQDLVGASMARLNSSEVQASVCLLKISTCLERIGDHAVSICELYRISGDLVALVNGPAVLRLTSVVQTLLLESIQAAIAFDLRKASRIMAQRRKIRAQHLQISERLLHLRTTTRHEIVQELAVQSLAKRLTDIAHQVDIVVEQICHYHARCGAERIVGSSPSIFDATGFPSPQIRLPSGSRINANW